MPRLSTARRDERRGQILDAARACVIEHGLEAVSMEMIIKRSGLSIGAVYRYFAGKDDILDAAISGGTAGLVDALREIASQDDPPPPADLLRELLDRLTTYGTAGVTDLTRAAVHGWSHSQSRPALAAAIQDSGRGLTADLAGACRRWQARGQISPVADPDAVAEVLTSLILGFIAQRTLTGTASGPTHAAGLAALMTAAPARDDQPPDDPAAPGTGSGIASPEVMRQARR